MRIREQIGGQVLEQSQRAVIGELTWNAEGNNQRSQITRSIHWPGGSSGVTIGRGYDMGHRTAFEVVSDLKAAGVSEHNARKYSEAAGRRGAAAKAFVIARKAQMPMLSEAQERALFEQVTYPRYRTQAKRLSERNDVVEKYGDFSFDEAPPPVQELLVDLLYRGDYTRASRQIFQPAFVRGARTALCEALELHEKQYPGVPRERARLRKESMGCANSGRALP